jgi:hypothetical protein
VTTKTKTADTEAAPVGADDDIDELRAKIARIENRNNNIDTSAKLAGQAARLTESRRAYIEEPDAANAAYESVQAELNKVWGDPTSTLHDLFDVYKTVALADGRRNAIAAATAEALEAADELPTNPLSGAYQSRRPRYERKHDPRVDSRQTFQAFVESAIQHWVGLDMVAARSRWQTKLSGIVDAAEAKTREAAELTEDGRVDVDVPESFATKYGNAVAELGDSSAGARLQVQRRMFVAEAGGKIPNIV